MSYPEVDIRRRLVRGETAAVVRAESVDAAMLVVGTRARTSGLGRLLGPVAAQRLVQPGCPVVLVRRRRRGRTRRDDATARDRDVVCYGGGTASGLVGDIRRRPEAED
jgi:hypothetical protein